MKRFHKMPAISKQVKARSRGRWLLAAALLFGAAAAAASPLTDWPSIKPASRIAKLGEGRFHAVEALGRTVISVGDNGLIAVSNDNGQSFAQAKAVPVRTMLTQVFLVDASSAWVVGHDGVILHSENGGVAWKLVRATPGVEAPLFDIHFVSPRHGFAVGLFGTFLETRDGGANWENARYEPPGAEQADRHLFKLWRSAKGTLFVATESGGVLRSADQGQSWRAIATGFKGALWFGRSLSNGIQIVCGMRGAVYLSHDDGLTWRQVDSGVKDSLATINEVDGELVITGDDGLVLTGRIDGTGLTAKRLGGGSAVIGVLSSDGRRRYVMSKGLVK